MRQEAEGSLRRLGVDVIDLYQIHWPNPDADVEEAWTEIARMIEEGKIRYTATSNFGISQIRRAQAIHPVASLQPPYSLLDRRVEAELLPFCAANDIGVVVYSPMGSGLLDRQVYTRERIAALPADDVRHKNGHFHDPELGPNLALIEALARRHTARVDRGPARRSPGRCAAQAHRHHRRARRPGQVAGSRRPAIGCCARLRSPRSTLCWRCGRSDWAEIEEPVGDFDVRPGRENLG